MGCRRLPSALVTGIWPISSLKVIYYTFRGSFWADFEIFEILGGAGDINNSISMLNYCNGPLSDLVGHVNKVLSAWAEVWSGSYRSRAKVLPPGGRSGQI